MKQTSGFVSSEFWLHVLALVAPIVGAALAASTNPLVAALATVVLGVASQVGAIKYAANRTDLKQAAQDAAATVVQAALPAVTQEVVRAVTAVPPAPTAP